MSQILIHKMHNFSRAIIIADFNPCIHHGHIRLIRTGLSEAKTVTVYVDSFNAGMTLNTPVPGRMRKAMVEKAIKEVFHSKDRARITVETIGVQRNDAARFSGYREIMRPGKDVLITSMHEQTTVQKAAYNHIDVVCVQPLKINRHEPVSTSQIKSDWIRNKPIRNARFVTDAGLETMQLFERMHPDEFHTFTQSVQMIDDLTFDYEKNQQKVVDPDTTKVYDPRLIGDKPL